ncbi:MAG TPA: hypothetical protein VHN80_26895, partial [Kineosporiaceae bacterium]|nr:hypothetical protein [Kineosporiaceae bacterium]
METSDSPIVEDSHGFEHRDVQGRLDHGRQPDPEPFGTFGFDADHRQLRGQLVEQDGGGENLAQVDLMRRD